MRKTILLLMTIILSIITIGCAYDLDKNNKEQDSTEDKNQEETIEWNTYKNKRFNFSIEYPKGWVYSKSQNGDGIAFFNDKERDIRVYGTNYIEDISEPYKSKEKQGVVMEEKKLSSGIKARIISGEQDEKYFYEMIVLEDNKEYHFVSNTSKEFFKENREQIEGMADSFKLTKDNQNLNELTKERALSIEDEFISRVFPERSANGLVMNFKNKEEITRHISEVAKQDVAKSFVDTYHKETNGKLYLRAIDGPARILKNSESRLEKIHQNEYHLIQEEENEMRGKYRLTIKFVREDGNWIIKERLFERR